MAILGCNGQVTFNRVSYDDDNFCSVIASMGITGLRVPGGTIANSWDPNTDVPLPAHIQNLYEETAVNILLVLNMITMDLEENIAWLSDLRTRSIPIAYIEMGNEFPDDDVWLAKFETKENYFAVCAEWIEAITNEFGSDVQFGIPAGGLYNATNNNEWNEGAIAVNPNAFLVWHYHNSELYTDTNGFVKKTTISRLINTDFRQSFQTISSDRIWMTEFNLKVKAGGGDEIPVFFADEDQKGVACKYMMKKFYLRGHPIVLFHNICMADGNGAIVSLASGSSLSATGLAIQTLISKL